MGCAIAVVLPVRVLQRVSLHSPVPRRRLFVVMVPKIQVRRAMKVQTIVTLLQRIVMVYAHSAQSRVSGLVVATMPLKREKNAMKDLIGMVMVVVIPVVPIARFRTVVMVLSITITAPESSVTMGIRSMMMHVRTIVVSKMQTSARDQIGVRQNQSVQQVFLLMITLLQNRL